MSLSAEIDIFDRNLIRRRRQRSAPRFGEFNFLKAEIASRLADRLDDINRSFSSALDLGCHDGQLTSRLQKGGKVDFLIQCDSALEHASAAGGVGFVADEEFLPLRVGSLDLITSALSLHWVNDLPGSLVQIRHALRPDGLFLAALFGGETLTELRQAFTQAELALEGGVSPRISPFLDIRDAGSLLQRAGFALPVADTDTITVDYADAFALMHDLRGMGETNAMRARRKEFSRKETLLATAEAYRDLFGAEDGRVRATFQIVYLTGWAPHESQQKPLRPGSAKIRLADALGTTEQGAQGEQGAEGDEGPRT